MKEIIRTQIIPVSLAEAWDFFSNPANLNRITPPDMRFRILNKNLPEKIHPGMIINYTVSPLLRIPVSWTTEITQVREPFFFVDEQKSGPFRFWHHQHHFKETGNGVEIMDIVNYAAPLGIIGKLAEMLIVDRKVDSIFTFRKEILESMYKSRFTGRK